MLVTGVHTLVLPFFFFFSSRRRHTRCSRDWSSDVCSSDLRVRHGLGHERRAAREQVIKNGAQRIDITEIGRASCRERGEISVVAVSLKKKMHRDRKSVV